MDRTAEGKLKLRAIKRTANPRGGFMRVGSVPTTQPPTPSDLLFEKKQQLKKETALKQQTLRRSSLLAAPGGAPNPLASLGMDPFVTQRLIYSSSFARTTAPSRAATLPPASSDLSRQPKLLASVPPSRKAVALAQRRAGERSCNAGDEASSIAAYNKYIKDNEDNEDEDDESLHMGAMSVASSSRMAMADVTFGYGDAVGNTLPPFSPPPSPPKNATDPATTDPSMPPHLPFFTTVGGHNDTIVYSIEVSNPSTPLPNDLRKVAAGMQNVAMPAIDVVLFDFKMQVRRAKLRETSCVCQGWRTECALHMYARDIKQRPPP